VFIPFVSGQPEHPEAGEFIFAEADTVLTRRWTWRQSSHTMTTLDTSDIEFNVDALPPVSQADAAAACREISELTARFCGGQMSVHVLSRENPSIRLRD
jgi:DNA/RNA-binding domain of Phe-tRNA-synthetase-like protein